MSVTNFANPSVHKISTGPEIWEDYNGVVDTFIAGVGTGAQYAVQGSIKIKNSKHEIIAVEPEESPILSKGFAGYHQFKG
jgi:cysteine synthase A